jgi:type IV pilus assembly protein PilW
MTRIEIPAPQRRRDAGVTLIELMIALAIGMFLMIGAVTVFMQGRQTFRLTEAIARLQENGRFALDAIEPDIRMAHYWGLTSRSTKVVGRAGAAEPNGLGPDGCGVNWTIDLRNAVAGSNNGYSFACGAGPAGGLGASATSDTLVVRRVAEDALAPAALTANTLYVQSARFQDSEIFAGTTVPATFTAATSETHRLIANGYYVSRSSLLGTNVPSLRMKTLVGGGTIEDQEVLPGVEDMQIQLGVDTDVVGGVNRGSIDRYVNPDDPIITPGAPGFLPDAEILAVRIWLRVRAERLEVGFTDASTYVYADQNVPAPNDGFRRVLVTKTIYLRNARPAT